MRVNAQRLLVVEGRVRAQEGGDRHDQGGALRSMMIAYVPG